MLKIQAMLVLLTLSPFTFAQEVSRLSLQEVAIGLSQPVAIVNAGDDSSRVFVIEQSGVIRILNTVTGILNETPFLDISEKVDSTSREQGLLGLTFHPDYADNGYFYVNYIRDPNPDPDPDPDLTVIARFKVSADNPDIADEDSESKLMEIPQDSSNHNGGDMHFGPDGYLYIAMGDGGGSNDTFGHAQDTNSLKGKILRIDVDGTPTPLDGLCGLIQNYAIPANNPFADSNGCDEIWSYGLRNPWRFSFDRVTGDMYIGDVGQSAWEEINFEPAGTAGVNYGWSCKEGAADFDLGNDCSLPDNELEKPIFQYDHNSWRCSVTGGYVYRGSNAAFNGYYFFGDYCSDQVWLTKKTDDGREISEWTAAAGILRSISSFGEDEDGELYIADRDAGKVYRIEINDIQFADSFEDPP